MVWTWRRKAMAEMAAEMGPRFVPLRIEGEATGIAATTSEPPPGRDQPAGSIEVAIGRARVRVEGAVDPEVLRQMLGLIGQWGTLQHPTTFIVVNLSFFCRIRRRLQRDFSGKLALPTTGCYRRP
jgi:hypothetical protein